MQQTAVTDRSEYDVNVGTGNLYVAASDLTIAGIAGHDLGVDGAYNSLRYVASEPTEGTSEYVGDFGAGWTSTLDSGTRIRVYPDQFRISYTHPSGWTESFYDRFGDNVYTSTRRSDLVITRNTSQQFEVTDQESDVTEVFSAGGRLRYLDDQFGNRITFNYSGEVLSSVTDTRGGGITTITRNGDGLIESLIDHTGRVASYTYDGLSLASVTDLDRETTTYTYGPAGQLATITSPEGGQHTFTYRRGAAIDSGAVESVTLPEGGVTTYAYQHTGLGGPAGTIRKVTATDPRNHATQYFGDARGRILKTVDARGVEQATSFDPFDNVIDFTGKTGGTPTVSSYSADGRFLNTITTPMGSAYTFGYDTGQDPYRPDTYTSPQGNTITYGYDATNGALRTIDDHAGNVTIDRHGNGAVRTVINQKGIPTNYTYGTDGLFRLVKTSQPSGARTVTIDAYDTLHRPTSVTDGNGNTTTYQYDALDRVKTITYDDATTVVYVYDGNGRRTTRTDPTGTTTTGYDDDGRITSEVFPAPRGQIDYDYDPAGNLETMTTSAGTVTYGYGPTNLLDTITEPGTTTPVRYDYESDSNNLEVLTFPTTTPVEQRYGYDDDDRLTTIEASTAIDVLTSFEYTYANNGTSTLRGSMIDHVAGLTTTYLYDPADRLKTATTPGGTSYGYDYDPASNRTVATVTPAAGTPTTTSYGYDEADQLCWALAGAAPAGHSCVAPAGATTYTHDDAGNLTTSTAGVNLDYNTANHTTQLSGLTGGPNPAATYAGPTQTERVTLAATTFTTSLVGITAGTTNGVTTRWLRDPGGNIVSQNTAGTRAYDLTDGLGSVAAVVDAAGTVRNRYTYSPYGETTETCTTTCIPNPWRYTGEHQDPTGMYKIGARYYSPDLGRWTQPDPVPSEFPFVYAAGDPVNRVDPTGTRSLTCGLPLVSALDPSCDRPGESTLIDRVQGSVRTPFCSLNPVGPFALVGSLRGAVGAEDNPFGSSTCLAGRLG